MAKKEFTQKFPVLGIQHLKQWLRPWFNLKLVFQHSITPHNCVPLSHYLEFLSKLFFPIHYTYCGAVRFVKYCLDAAIYFLNRKVLWEFEGNSSHSGNFSILGLSIQEFILDNDISRIGSHISSIYMLCTDLNKMWSEYTMYSKTYDNNLYFKYKCSWYASQYIKYGYAI